MKLEGRWDLVGFVHASDYRERILMSLEQGPQTPSSIARGLGYPTNHVSEVLADLTAMELIECLSPRLRKGRLYQLTALGTEVLQTLQTVRSPREDGPRHRA